MEKKYNPFGLPESVNENWSPVTLPFTKGRGLIIADLHVPYHSIEAITIAINWAREKGICRYDRLKAKGYPPGYQTLCSNCNLIKQLTGGTLPLSSNA